MLDLKKELELIKEPIYKAVKEVLDSGSYILGSKGKELENCIAKYIKTSYAIGVANGSDALLLALKALKIGEGDEVITTPFTFFATAESIALSGAKPVFVDIDQNTYNIDPKKIEEAVTSKTKAVIIVHLFGYPAEMDSIMDIAKKHNLKVIEDACQAIGTEYKGKRVGSIGHVGCFSFFPSKNLGAFGDAGMIVTNERDLYEKIIELRNHGSSKHKYIHKVIGHNSRLDDIQAAILIEKLKYLDEFLKRRREIAKRYTEKLNRIVKTPSIFQAREHTFHQYCIETNKRDELSLFLNNKNIATAIYYPIPLHLQEAFKYLKYKEGDFPITENISKRILALPIYPVLTLSEQKRIISSIKEFFEK
ncbi:DegT/DnrJ/EryC1/StrS family aminotransferase [Metabacillus sp. Hm71]|uniref:DegT/DnrJ/EryC1/StrS family aminotransferase n=1 Tax=Metabacillus sp. Hm71 TaxID=3450743 RepID=UPI003F43BB9B